MSRGKGKACSGEIPFGCSREGKAQGGGECCGGWSWDVLGKCGGRVSGKAVKSTLQLEVGRKRKTPREGGAGGEMMGGDYRHDKQVYL